VRGAALDVTDSAAVDRAFDAAAAPHGRLDIVFANAGIDPGPGFVAIAQRGQRIPEHQIENYSDERWHKVVGVSLDAVFYSIRAAARLMKPAGRGSIVVTTSISAVRPAPAIGMAYMAAKAGAAHLVRTSALELARYGIRVNAIAPGPFATNIALDRADRVEFAAAQVAAVPLGRVASPEEIKGLALLLASNASSFITGEQIVIDGGVSLGAAS
jgi:NAD(P)-dependent dehydrogenase (short-subunit alcohol dehydrogenase family)